MFATKVTEETREKLKKIELEGVDPGDENLTYGEVIDSFIPKGIYFHFTPVHVFALKYHGAFWYDIFEVNDVYARLDLISKKPQMEMCSPRLVVREAVNEALDILIGRQETE